MSAARTIAVALVAAGAAFVAGRASVDDDTRALSSSAPRADDPVRRGDDTEQTAGAPERRHDEAPRGAGGRVPAREGQGDVDHQSRGEGVRAADAEGAPRVVAPGAPSTSGAATCEDALAAAEARVQELERRRREFEGEPIAPKTDVAPRHRQEGLLDTFQQAFRATGIEGAVESVDCTEFPCILFGRLQGDEELVAALEDSRPFKTYDEDVGVMLTWASGDHAHGDHAKPGLEREKPPEVSLFAFAFYSHEDKAAHGDALDKRIRVRTAEYWNSVRPDDHAHDD